MKRDLLSEVNFSPPTVDATGIKIYYPSSSQFSSQILLSEVYC